MDQNENQPVIEKCPFCSEKIAPGMTKCTHCGEEFGAHSIKPGLSKEVAQIIPDLQPAWHFAVLSAAKLGLYEIYWFYRNWRQLGAYKELDILPGKKPSPDSRKNWNSRGKKNFYCYWAAYCCFLCSAKCSCQNKD